MNPGTKFTTLHFCHNLRMNPIMLCWVPSCWMLNGVILNAVNVTSVRCCYVECCHAGCHCVYAMMVSVIWLTECRGTHNVTWCWQHLCVIQNKLTEGSSEKVSRTINNLVILIKDCFFYFNLSTVFKKSIFIHQNACFWCKKATGAW